jgi:hypothetical protein
MGVIFNYLDETERTFLEPEVFAAGIDDLWTSDGTLSLDAVNYQDAEYGSLKLVPSSSENYVRFNIHPTTESTPSQYALTLPIDNQDYVESFIWVKPSKNCTLFFKTILSEVSFDENTGLFSLVDPFNQVVGSEGSLVVALGGTDTPKWQLIRSVPVEIPDTGRWAIQLQFRVVFEDTTDAFINISRPTAHASLRLFSNDFLTSVLEYLPEIFLESDTANYSTNQPTFPLSRLIDVMTSEANNVLTKSNSFEYVDSSEGGNPNILGTLSTFVNPQVCDSAYLTYLAQFRGRPILVTYQPSTEGVGWEIFALNDSLLDSGDVLGNDAVNLGGLPAGIDSFARWQVETGYYGHNAGTVNSMIGAIQRNLTGAKVVNYTMTQNSIAFTTSQAETFGTVAEDVGTSNSIILTLIEPARPLGMLVTHTLTA